jgi:hypothetical protein
MESKALLKNIHIGLCPVKPTNQIEIDAPLISLKKART